MTRQQLRQALVGFWWGLTVGVAFLGGIFCGAVMRWPQ